MSYTEEEIKRYLEILYNYTKPTLNFGKPKCWSCQRSDRFTIYSGYKLCESCGGLNGYVLGYFDQKDLSRLNYRKKEYLSEKVSL